MPLPEWLEPMKATLTRERFEGPEWVFERKLDGIRLLAYKNGRQVRLLTRNKLVRNAWYPEIAEAVAELPVRNATLDGEATGMFGARGVPNGYHLFDVLWLDGKSVAARPLAERRKLLMALGKPPPRGSVPNCSPRRWSSCRWSTSWCTPSARCSRSSVATSTTTTATRDPYWPARRGTGDLTAGR